MKTMSRISRRRALVDVGVAIASLAGIRPAAGAESEMIKVRLKVNGSSLEATLKQHETARDFLSLLPLTLTMRDLFGREKIWSSAESHFGVRRADPELSSRRHRLLVAGAGRRGVLSP
jgi:hypothetical protein